MSNKPAAKEMPPRLRGAILLGLSAFMVAFNLFLAARLHEFFRILFPLAGFITPLGVFLIVHGVTTTELRRGAVPRRVVQMMFAAMLAGLLLGLWANHVRFGRAF